MAEESDHWHRWLLQTRFGGDADTASRELAERLHPVRDKVLDNAGLQPHDTLLDVGAGDGMIAFGALERPGFSGPVIIADVSADLIGHCRQVAAARGWQDRNAAFTAHLRPLVEGGTGQERMAFAFLTAGKDGPEAA